MALVSGPTLGRRPGRPVQRADPAGVRAGRRREADRRAVRADPEPPADRRPRSRPAARRSRPSTTTTAGWPRSSAAARPSSPSSGPSWNASAGRHRRRASRPGRLREGAGAAACRAQRKKAETTAKLEADLKNYEATGLAKKLADWEKKHAAAIVNRWAVLEPKTTSATNRSAPTKQPDGSIFVSGPNKNGVVTIVVETELTGITGLRLEVLTDSRLPNNGPGRATDGNFVLNELELTAAPKADPKQAKPVKLEKPWPTSARTTSPIAKAIDGNAERGGQWLGRFAGDRDHPLGDVRDRAAGRRTRRHGPDLQAAPQVRRCLDARPLPAFGHPWRQAGWPEPARRPPRHPGRRAEVRTRGPEERPAEPTSASMDADLQAKTARCQRQQGTAAA